MFQTSLRFIELSAISEDVPDRRAQNIESFLMLKKHLRHHNNISDSAQLFDADLLLNLTDLSADDEPLAVQGFVLALMEDLRDADADRGKATVMAIRNTLLDCAERAVDLFEVEMKFDAPRKVLDVARMYTTGAATQSDVKAVSDYFQQSMSMMGFWNDTIASVYHALAAATSFPLAPDHVSKTLSAAASTGAILARDAATRSGATEERAAQVYAEALAAEKLRQKAFLLALAKKI